MTGRRIELLDATHELAGFRCGNEALDFWLAHHALASQRMDSARTFVLTDKSDGVIGYFSLTMGLVLRADAPQKLVHSLPGYPVGVALLARLAVHSDHHHEGLGGSLLAEALHKAVTASEAAAARLVVVDAIDDAAIRLYQHDGFLAVPEHPQRLYRRLKDIRASLDRARQYP